MASEPSRASAKGAIRDEDASDPELDATIAAGSKLRLDLIREQNRHEEARSAAELGFIGRAFGGEKSAPTFVAMIAMIFGIAGAGGAMALAAFNPDSAEFWGTQVERAMAFASAALAFIFGRGSKT